MFSNSDPRGAMNWDYDPGKVTKLKRAPKPKAHGEDNRKSDFKIPRVDTLLVKL